jgi:hypothetical protein
VVILPLALAACSTSPATVKKTSFVGRSDNNQCG